MRVPPAILYGVFPPCEGVQACLGTVPQRWHSPGAPTVAAPSPTPPGTMISTAAPTMSATALPFLPAPPRRRRRLRIGVTPPPRPLQCRHARRPAAGRRLSPIGAVGGGEGHAADGAGPGPQPLAGEERSQLTTFGLVAPPPADPAGGGVRQAPVVAVAALVVVVELCLITRFQGVAAQAAGGSPPYHLGEQCLAQPPVLRTVTPPA
jgi:hypothetical protein